MLNGSTAKCLIQMTCALKKVLKGDKLTGEKAATNSLVLDANILLVEQNCSTVTGR